MWDWGGEPKKNIYLYKVFALDSAAVVLIISRQQQRQQKPHTVVVANVVSLTSALRIRSTAMLSTEHR